MIRSDTETGPDLKSVQGISIETTVGQQKKKKKKRLSWEEDKTTTTTTNKDQMEVYSIRNFYRNIQE